MTAPVARLEDGWATLRELTAARIALGRCGASLPTGETLAFELAHAQARDAVLIPLDVEALKTDLEGNGWHTLRVCSRASSQQAYLARPDWGRRLRTEDAAELLASKGRYDVVFVISDGLSARAVQEHAAALLAAVAPLLRDLAIAPVVIATRARVALADEVGEAFGARIAVSLIGERPGLSSPDSLGIYLTYDPKLGRNDGERNCISNVRPAGLPIAEAATQLAAMIRAALHAKLSGIGLQAERQQALAESASP